MCLPCYSTDCLRGIHNSFSGNCDFNALSELRNLKGRIEELESEIRERDEEVRVLKESAQMKLINGEDNDTVKVGVPVIILTVLHHSVKIAQ